MRERDPAQADSDVDAHVRGTVERWPQVDPEVERIVVSLGRADRLVQKAATVSLARVGLSYEEFKVLIALHRGPRSHGSLCRELLVSTGAMTNRLDKLEGSGLLTRQPDPSDRRGVLLAITDAGRERLDAYIALQARREIDLLSVFEDGEKQELNRLLGKLVDALQSELGPAPRRSPVAAGDTAADADPA